MFNFTLSECSSLQACSHQPPSMQLVRPAVLSSTFNMQGRESATLRTLHTAAQSSSSDKRMQPFQLVADSTYAGSPSKDPSGKSTPNGDSSAPGTPVSHSASPALNALLSKSGQLRSEPSSPALTSPEDCQTPMGQVKATGMMVTPALKQETGTGIDGIPARAPPPPPPPPQGIWPRGLPFPGRPPPPPPPARRGARRRPPAQDNCHERLQCAGAATAATSHAWQWPQADAHATTAATACAWQWPQEDPHTATSPSPTWDEGVGREANPTPSPTSWTHELCKSSERSGGANS